jgi:pyrroline-5-carboxylate reductase
MDSEKIGFLGGGQMATALAQGALANHLLTPERLHFCEPSKMQADKLRSRFEGCTVHSAPEPIFTNCSTIVLAIKPQVLVAVHPQYRPLIRSNHLILSIVAGISIDSLSEWLGTDRIIRVMPNTPVQVLAGASGIAYGNGTTDEDRAWAKNLMQSVGLAVEVIDSQLHAVTGVSGSGPAYVLTVIEAMADGGVAAGLSRPVALQLAAQTVLGAARMVLETGEHPATLRDQVASPGGTTIEAIRTLERQGLRSALIEAVLAATKRSKELAG